MENLGEISGRTLPVEPGAGPQPGEIFAGKYRVDSLLGQGGMGSVWRARCLVRGVDVAVKVVRPDAMSPCTRGRLLREARAAASLGHPSIVRVFDFGVTDQGDPFMVMELLDGRPLRKWIDEAGRLPALLAVELMLPLASALEAAHSHGIIHRDVKPENVIVTRDEAGALVPKLVDFGIVKVEDERDADTAFTQRGVTMGSPEYMSPEQVEGIVELDSQSDQWSFCVMLYELITGCRPFEGPSIRAVMFSILATEPTPTTHWCAGDGELWEIVRRGLEKDPADRWPSMMHLGRALARWAAERGMIEPIWHDAPAAIETSPTRRRSPRRRLAWATPRPARAACSTESH